MNTCQVEGCGKTVSKAGYVFCLGHWKAERSGEVLRCERCGRWHENQGPLCRECSQSTSMGATPSAPSPSERDEDEGAGSLLTSTKIGQHFGLSSIKTNLILAELGWIEKYVKGWIPTERGNALGANVREMRNGTPFVVWPESILQNPALLASIGEQTGIPTLPEPASSQSAGGGVAAPSGGGGDFRSKFPATFRTQDGHMVRSRAEVLIDNWLYMQGLVHAYERRFPIEEECYCDFYLPGGRGAGGKGVYIEFWGRESDPKYRDRQAAKRAIYAKHQLRLIELADAEIERLDDVLPRLLLKFGIESA